MVLIQPADNLENRSEPSLVLRPGHAEELEQKVYFIKSWAFERFLRYCADSSNSIREKQCEFSRYPIYCVYVTTVRWCEAQRNVFEMAQKRNKKKTSACPPLIIVIMQRVFGVSPVLDLDVR